MNIIKRLYNWVLSWSETKWGPLALFLLALTEASFFPLPPDILLIALCLGMPKKSFRYASICLAGTLIGAVLAYLLGYFMWQTPDGSYSGLAEWFYAHIFSMEAFDNIKVMFEEYDFWIIFTAGFTPVPYKLFTIAAGVFDLDFTMFMIASAISRGARFFLVGGLIWKFGAPIKSFIDKYFNLLVTILTILLIGGFFAIKYLF
jgi:membrane protein YqaA with SNARE-associated domain